ncbi:glycosyltransferase family 61 protein [Agrobacterium rosae]|uniref:glycosyltransferase family 61 protein n=1 Tax=Agrobacterium rosae TaxID=1972867 RepID=UPI003A8053CD
MQNFVTVKQEHAYKCHEPLVHNVSFQDDEIKSYFYTQITTPEQKCPPEGYFEFDNVFSYEEKFLYREGNIFEITCVDFLQKNELENVIDGKIKSENFTKIALSNRIDIIFCKAGSGNFGHFLTECAPRLLNLRGLNKKFRIHLPRESAMFANIVVDICEYMGLDVEVRIGRLGEVTHYKKAIYLSAVSQHNTRKSLTFKNFRDLILDMYKIKHNVNNKIYICRNKNEKRSIENQDDLIGKLSDLGFVIVHPTHHSFRTQVEIFSSASVLCGSLGAGFTNIMWASEGCRSFFIDPGLTDYFFWDIANIMNQRFHWYFQGPVSRWSQEFSERNYEINTDDVMRQVRAI